MDKNLAREFKYRYGKGNLSLHVWNSIKSQINTGLPIRPSNKWSPSQIDDLKLDIQIFLNQYELLKILAQDHEEAKEYLNLLHIWNEDNNESVVSRMKDLERIVRLSNYPLEVQSVLSFHRSYDFCPSKEMQNSLKIAYINDFMADEKYDCLDYHFDNSIIKILANNLIANIRKRVEDEILYSPPSCSIAMSPIGKKQYDIKCIRNILNTTPLIDEVYDTYTQINSILDELDYPKFDLIKSVGEISNQQFLMNIKLLPRLNYIPNPGKMRPVFMSNDLYDIILDPLRMIVELCYRSLPCSYSSKKIFEDNYLNVDIPENVRSCQENSQIEFKSGLVNSDLSSATDRMFYRFQENIVIDIFSFLSENDRELISSYFKINDLENYIRSSLRILSHSWINYDYINDKGNQVYGLRIPKYGQCQGQRGSFALLNITHICVNLQAMLDSGFAISLKSFLVNGDDGVLPQKIVESYNRIWINNSADGIKSADKSSDTVRDYVEFCKQYVVDKFKPQPLNGLRYRSYIKTLIDPSMLMILKIKFTKSDYYISFSKLQNRLKTYESDYDHFRYISVPILDNIELRFKLYSIISEMKAKYCISLSNDPSVRNLFRSLIDDSNHALNVFDREKWFPDKEYSITSDWQNLYGPLPLVKKYDLKINGLIEFDTIEAINFIISNKRIPIEVVELGKYDKDAYQVLNSLIVGKKQSVLLNCDFVRRTSQLEIHVEIDKIKPHRLLVSTDVVDVSSRRDKTVMSSH